jgi:hypothetical protein
MLRRKPLSRRSVKRGGAPQDQASCITKPKTQEKLRELPVEGPALTMTQSFALALQASGQ